MSYKCAAMKAFPAHMPVFFIEVIANYFIKKPPLPHFKKLKKSPAKYLTELVDYFNLYYA